MQQFVQGRLQVLLHTFQTLARRVSIFGPAAAFPVALCPKPRIVKTSLRKSSAFRYRLVGVMNRPRSAPLATEKACVLLLLVQKLPDPAVLSSILWSRFRHTRWRHGYRDAKKNYSRVSRRPDSTCQNSNTSGCPRIKAQYFRGFGDRQHLTHVQCGI